MRRELRDAVPKLLVRAASAMVPPAERAEWAAEWCAELWHVQHAEDADETRTSALSFSWGAAHDAFWLGWNAAHALARTRLRAGSAARCGLLLGSLAALGILGSLHLPGARAVLSPPLPYRDAKDLVILSSNGYPGTQTPSIRMADYREWTTDTGGLYSEIAYYRPTVDEVHVKHQATATLAVAVASGNLLTMLKTGTSVDATSAGPRLYLSRSAWRRKYHGDAAIFGRVATVAGQEAVIAGVLPDTAWRLPGKAEAWLLEDARGLAWLPPTAKGFLVARIRDAAFPAPKAGWRYMVETRKGVFSRYSCISLESLAWQPVATFPIALLLALLALPALTALSLGEYPLSRERQRGWVHARRWLFLATKFLLVSAIVFFGATALAYGPGWLSPTDAAAMQGMASFPALLFGYRWMLRDQRKRCPVCLGLLTNPARVGQASCNFLSWCGTELICASGHGLLHIPELETSWFGTQRWLGLDPSWLCLFSEGAGGSPEPV